MRSRRGGQATAAALAAALLAGCGSSSPRFSVERIDTGASAITTTTHVTPSTTLSTAPGSTGSTGGTGRTGATGSGTSTTAAGSWVAAAGSLAGLSSECGNLSFAAVRPDRDELIVSVAKQGLWSSKAGSSTFVRLGQGSDAGGVNNRGTQILFDPSNPDIFWESGAYGGGVYRTNDGGKTFQRLGSIEDSDPVSIDFSDPARATMLSGKHESSNLRRSTNGGATWTDVTSLPVGVGFVTYPLVLDAKTFLLGTQGGSQSGIFRSTDGGATWTQVMSGATNSPALVTADGIYWLLDNGALVRSTDKGVTWNPIRPAGFATPVSENMIRQTPDGRLYTIGRSVLVSSDKGTTWTAVGPLLPYVANGVVFNPFRNEFVIWHFDCDFATANPVRAESIMKLAVQPAG